MLGFLRRQFHVCNSAIIKAIEPRIRIAASTKGRNWLESDSRLFEFIPQICQIFPNAKFIHLTRNRESWLKSAFDKGGYKDEIQRNHWNHFQIKPYNDKEFESKKQKEKLKWYYDFVNEKILQDSERFVSSQSILRVSLEDQNKDRLTNEFLGVTKFKFPHLNKSKIH